MLNYNNLGLYVFMSWMSFLLSMVFDKHAYLHIWSQQFTLSDDKRIIVLFLNRQCSKTMTAIFRVILGPDSCQRVVFPSGLPSTVTDLETEIKTQCKIKQSFRLQFMDTLFGNDFINPLLWKFKTKLQSRSYTHPADLSMEITVLTLTHQPLTMMTPYVLLMIAP